VRQQPSFAFSRWGVVAWANHRRRANRTSDDDTASQGRQLRTRERHCPINHSHPPAAFGSFIDPFPVLFERSGFFLRFLPLHWIFSRFLRTDQNSVYIYFVFFASVRYRSIIMMECTSTSSSAAARTGFALLLCLISAAVRDADGFLVPTFAGVDRQLTRRTPIAIAPPLSYSDIFTQRRALSDGSAPLDTGKFDGLNDLIVSRPSPISASNFQYTSPRPQQPSAPSSSPQGASSSGGYPGSSSGGPPPPQGAGHNEYQQQPQRGQQGQGPPMQYPGQNNDNMGYPQQQQHQYGPPGGGQHGPPPFPGGGLYQQQQGPPPGGFPYPGQQQQHQGPPGGGSPYGGFGGPGQQQQYQQYQQAPPPGGGPAFPPMGGPPMMGGPGMGGGNAGAPPDPMTPSSYSSPMSQTPIGAAGSQQAQDQRAQQSHASGFSGGAPPPAAQQRSGNPPPFPGPPTPENPAPRGGAVEVGTTVYVPSLNAPRPGAGGVGAAVQSREGDDEEDNRGGADPMKPKSYSPPRSAWPEDPDPPRRGTAPKNLDDHTPRSFERYNDGYRAPGEPITHDNSKGLDPMKPSSFSSPMSQTPIGAAGSAAAFENDQRSQSSSRAVGGANIHPDDHRPAAFERFNDGYRAPPEKAGGIPQQQQQNRTMDDYMQSMDRNRPVPIQQQRQQQQSSKVRTISDPRNFGELKANIEALSKNQDHYERFIGRALDELNAKIDETALLNQREFENAIVGSYNELSKKIDEKFQSGGKAATSGPNDKSINQKLDELAKKVDLTARNNAESEKSMKQYHQEMSAKTEASVGRKQAEFEKAMNRRLDELAAKIESASKGGTGAAAGNAGFDQLNSKVESISKSQKQYEKTINELQEKMFGLVSSQQDQMKDQKALLETHIDKTKSGLETLSREVNAINDQLKVLAGQKGNTIPTGKP